MKVRLWKDNDALGKRGDVVEVSDGFARNYLFPRREAGMPTPGADREFELEKRRQARMEQKLISDAKAVAAKLAGLAGVSIEVNTNEEGHLYGSVTPTMIAERLKDQGLKVEPRTVEIKDPIKQVGEYQVTINLHRDVKPALKVAVVSTKPPAAPGEPAKA
jgi:large subunit ribosomal protein L9